MKIMEYTPNKRKVDCQGNLGYWKEVERQGNLGYWKEVERQGTLAIGRRLNVKGPWSLTGLIVKETLVSLQQEVFSDGR